MTGGPASIHPFRLALNFYRNSMPKAPRMYRGAFGQSSSLHSNSTVPSKASSPSPGGRGHNSRCRLQAGDLDGSVPRRASQRYEILP
jgi:hypothetical protein